MRIAIGCDHRGYHLKGKLISLLHGLGHDAVDVGCDSVNSVDYPDYAAGVCRLVSKAEADRGILVCGTGIGMAITANKFRGVRAATCQDELTAEMCRRHNDVNVLCLSGDMLGERCIDGMIEIWLNTEFEGGRHARRVAKIAELEQENCGPSCG
jgi:ribose 5-phosphate isomerase B